MLVAIIAGVNVNDSIKQLINIRVDRNNSAVHRAACFEGSKKALGLHIKARNC